MRDGVGVVGDQAFVVDERLPSGVEMALAFGNRGVQNERGRLERIPRARLLQGALGGVGLSVKRKGAAVQHQDIARRVRTRRHAAERFERLAQIDAIVMRLRPVEPYLAKRAVDERLPRCALERAAQREHRHLLATRARLRQAERDLTLDVVAIEAGNQLQLLDFFVVMSRRSV